MLPATHPATIPRVRRRRWALGAAVVAALALVVAITGTAGHVRACFAALADVHWAFLVALGVLSALHYVLAGITLRAVAEVATPLGETILVQFTAAAANRLTPSGLGAAAVNTRYLVCRGTDTVRAVTSVAVMQVMGAVADLLLLLAIAALSPGSGGTLGLLASRAVEAAGALPVAPALALVAVVAVIALVCGGRVLRSRAAAHALARVLAGCAGLLRRPGDLCLTLLASAATTLVMAVALAVATLAVPGTGVAPADLWIIVTAYMIGSAAGSALPSPGGVGGTEAALVATLTAVGVAAGPALHAVLLFRALTYWAPVPFGAVAARRLSPMTERGI
ncbi:lysylphosphatidylglycerol synthase transmembrane domain-containing protein [Thermomonospora umbrina]|uniref:lysylphosphatidylglycerol synthase transmembrane domain-containing protein n=1 Tax=Thermomonospora umbrina TaxID=111806 RepID=UPI0014773ED6|nr:lysylphosphatidylglycerol synthase domain-containing protein [Thermomonospora umbrina]